MNRHARPQPAASAPAPPHESQPSWWSWLAALGLATVVLVQLLVANNPQLVWDVNPLAQKEIAPTIMFSSAGSAWLNAVETAVLALALVGCAVEKRRLHGWSLALAGMGIGWTWWHVQHDGAMDAYQGGAWIGATALGVAALHLAGHRRLRQFLAAVLLAAVVPVGAQALHYVFIEHAQTVSYYESHEAQALLERGWEPGSPQHLIYRRRLLNPEATGVFGMSNVLGSAAGALALLGLGMALGLGTTRPRGKALLPGVLLIMATATLALSHSRGGAVATALVAGFMLVSWAARKYRPRWLRLAPWGMLAIVIAMAALVLGRLVLGPPATVEGERSLLFRGYYWQGAQRLITQEPLPQALAGTGVRAFKDLYLRYKNPLNPEDVVSVHNVFLDQIVMLGLGGLAWSVLLAGWLWRAGRGLGDAAPAPAETPPVTARATPTQPAAAWQAISLRDTWPVVVVGACAFGVQAWVQAPVLSVDYGLWCIGVWSVFTLTAVMLSQRAWFSADAMRWGLGGAACVLLAHAQIEMTFYVVGATALAWAMMGLAASAIPTADDHTTSTATPGAAAPAATKAPTPRWCQTAAIVLAAVLAAGMAITAVRENARQALLLQAARLGQQGQPARAGDLLTQAQQLQGDLTIAQGQVGVALALGEQIHDPAQALRAVDEELNALQTRWTIPSSGVAYLRAQVATYLAQLHPTNESWAQAVTRWHEAAALAPYQPRMAYLYAQALEQAGRRAEAREQYRRALQLSDQAYLDPLAQLAPALRATAQARINEP